MVFVEVDEIMKKIIFIITIFCSVVSFVSCYANEDIYCSGMDCYIDGCQGISEYEVEHFLYSSDFITKYQYDSGNFHYFEAKELRGLATKGGHELAIMYLKYSPDVYLSAKNDLINNSDYLSSEPLYQYNGYNFYRLDFHSSKNYWYAMNAYNDEKQTLVFLGFYGGFVENGKNGRVGELPPESAFSEYLNTHFGEFYDFNA